MKMFHKKGKDENGKDENGRTENQAGNEKLPKEGVRNRVKRVSRRVWHWVKKHKIFTVIILVITIALTALGVKSYLDSRKPDMSAAQMIETATIEKQTLTDSISVTGTVASADAQTVTTGLSDITATEVYVQEGDEVQAGDIICVFDSADIEEALADAQTNYTVNQELSELQNDYESTYAESIDSAEDTLQSVRDARDEAKEAYETAEDEETAAATVAAGKKTEYDAAGTTYEAAKTAANNALAEKSIFDDIDLYISNTAMSQMVTDGTVSIVETYQSAKAAYETAQSAYNQAQSAYETAQKNTTEKYTAYEKAQSTREDAQEVYEDSIEKAEQTYEQAQLSDQLVTDTAEKTKINEYIEELDDCTVKATMSGTITSINVEAGLNFAGGTIYTIQDNSNFIVSATVDEYDICNVEEGMKAYIELDSLEDEQLEGEVTYVAVTPGTSSSTSTSGSSGSVSSSATYALEITISGEQDRARTGMTAKVSISKEESVDTLTVPYDCVQTNADGDSIIYIDNNGERKEVVVETGIETDYYIEVISDELSEGMTVYLATEMVQSAGTSETATEEEDSALSLDLGKMSGSGGGGTAPSGGGGTPPSGF